MLKQLPVIYNLTLHKNMRHGYKVPGIIIIANIPVSLKLTERSHHQSKLLEQLYA
jgi:hypothetical protein